MYKLLIIFVLASIAKSSPVSQTETVETESEWAPPNDLSAVQEAINDVRILLADISYVGSQILQDLQSKDIHMHVTDAGKLGANVDDLLKALKVGVYRISLSADPTQLNGFRSQMNMLHILVKSVRELFTATKHALHDFGTLSNYSEGLKDVDNTLVVARDNITTILDFINEENTN